ncbi:MAG: 4-hydroxy-tetrahydrodipicolinate synthase [Fimbriimonadaceae bacterium]|nr:4-hydroxy-tetrahydrodipicolinate synthase [Fimbriimonadaceae bacterium]
MNSAPRPWGRLLTAMLTPFHPDGSVNYEEAQRIATYLVDDQKNDGIVVSGTTGESPTLTDQEKLNLLRATKEAVGDRASVVFGAGSYDTAHTLHMIAEGEKGGADGIMVVNPYYNRPGQAGLLAHFTASATATELPIMVYNIQPRSAINLETDTLMRLVERCPNVKAVKEASGILAQIGEVIRRAPDGFVVYSGDDGLTLPILSLGGVGLVSVAAHIVGRELAEMIEIFASEPAKARKIHHTVMPVIEALFSAPSPVPVKWALAERGFACRNVRLPLVELSDLEIERVRTALAQFPVHA